MIQSIQLTQPQSRQQIFKELDIKRRSPPTLMRNAMPVQAFLSCTTTRLILHLPAYHAVSSPSSLEVPAYSRMAVPWPPSPHSSLALTEAPISPSCYLYRYLRGARHK